MCNLLFYLQDMSSQVLSSILYNSPDLFKIDLKGVQSLIPDVITALEMVLPQKDMQLRLVDTPKVLTYFRYSHTWPA